MRHKGGLTNQFSFIKKFRSEVLDSANEIKNRSFSQQEIGFDDFLVAKVINGKETATEYGRHWVESIQDFYIYLSMKC